MEVKNVDRRILRNRVLLEKLTVTVLVGKFLAVYGPEKVRYCVHKSPPLAPILSQIQSAYTFTSHFFISFNSLFPSDSPNNISCTFVLSPMR
jgi:hypothetical protein